ncbi:MAG TPA: DUF637 domain-containing protein, partial [Stellaceae bacterium]|nr:DUF637 domain-containing protein [Stellaceae bacterium]
LSGASVALTLSGGGLTVEKGGLIDGGTGGTRLTLAGGAAIEGMVASAGALSVNAANLDVTGSLQSGGTQSLTLNGAFSNEGRIFAGDGFTLTTPGSVTNAAGASLIAGQTLGGAVTVTAASITNGGAITFGGSGTLNAGSLSNSGPLVANGVLTLTGLSTLSNSATGLVLGVGGLSITASNSVDNEGGALLAGGDLVVSGPQGSAVGTLTNSSGVIGSASGSVSLTAGTLINQRSNFSVADVLTYDQTFNDVVAIPSLAMILALPTVPGTSAAGEVANGSVAAIYDRFVNPHSSKAEPNGTAVMVTDEDGFVSYYQFGPVRVFATTTQVTGGAAASISAGRNLTISANTITNAESSITAAGNLTLSGSGTLTNSGVELQRQEFFQGSSTSSNNGTNNRCLGGACEQFLQPNQTIEARNDIVGDAAATIQAGGALVVAMGNVVNNSQLGSGVMPAGVIVGVSSIGQPAAVATLTAATPTGLGVGGPAAGLVAAPVSLKAPLTPSRFTAAALNAGGGFAALAVKQVSLAQAQANLATVIPGFSALFTPAPPNASALFETRFDFTQLGPFFGSSFFMNAAGYHPEMLMKTLGDAYFDTALITAEIQAQTGRRWLEPQYSDDSSEMKALLEAGASVARDLHLAEGVGLTPAQVASLTQDVVIYVSENVGGQAVLVPALYLAKNAANLATGPASVLAGRNVTIVSGDSLMNTGTIEAGNNLSILVQNNLTNLSGRITAGGDLSLIARTGDIVNQTFTQDWSAASGLMSHTLVGRTALIEAGGNLTAVAGHDVQILGADLGAGKNLALFAGNDLAIGTIGLKDQFSESGPYGWSSRNNLTQVGSQLSAGGSLGITALNSIDIAGSALSAAKNLQVQAGGSLTVESAQDLIDEQSHYSGGNWTKETVNSTHESVTQLRSVLSAGGDVALTAGTGNLVLASSSIEAGGAVDLSAVNGQILLQARLDTLLQDKSRSGSNMLWQSLADKGERVATAQMVEIEHGGALTAEAGHGIVIDYAVLPPPAPAAPAPPPTTSLLQRPPSSGTLGMASRPTPLPVRPPPQDPKAASMAALQANLATLSRMPGLGYLSELSGRNDVTLRAVAQAQESWNHQAQGVSGPAAAVIAVAIIAATYGYGTPAAAAELGAATTVTVELAAEAAAEAALTAAISTLATQATLSLISNQGDIGKTFQDLGSRRDLTQLATSVVTAALTAGLTEGLGLSVPANASFLDKLPTVAERAAVSVGVNTAVGTAINGGNLGQNFLTNLRSGAASVVGELGANEIGQLLNPGGSLNQALGSAAEPLQLLAHAGLGCATGALGGGHCTAGAEGGVVGELAGQALFSSFADS